MKSRPYHRRRDALHRRLDKVFLWLAHELAFKRLTIDVLQRRLNLRLAKIGCLPLESWALKYSVRDAGTCPIDNLSEAWSNVTLVEPRSVWPSHYERAVG
ncbi:hypothetical protein [Pararhodobacter sp.]|uniref:hypothetical protein n=1 Tax=Pararhodobacter sp. TaxID=2127056 RepID=UPI002AFEA2E3|nr:hypothetical protein [Pararhodobacter sp.]